MNNKGQSLVLFILILPVILLVLIMIIDISKMILVKNEINNINYLATDYALNNYDKLINNSNEYKIKELIYKNKSDINDIIIEIKEEEISITIIYKSDLTIFRDIFEIESMYKGYIKNQEKIIERIK